MSYPNRRWPGRDDAATAAVSRRKHIPAASERIPNWRDGTIYPVLRHLEKQGLVTGHWKGPKEGRQRRYYRLTPRGRRVWQQQRRQWTTFTRAINALLNR